MSNAPESSDYGQRQRETLLVAMMIFLVGGGFVLFMTFVTGGFFAYTLAVCAGLGLVGCFHYLVWGHRFSQQVREEREAFLREEEEKQKAEDRPWDRRF